MRELVAFGSDAALWQGMIDRMPLETRDIHFTPAYARVQQHLGGECIVLVLENGGDFCLKPICIRPIDGGPVGACDLSSFYGGGGAITARTGISVGLFDMFTRAQREWNTEMGVVAEYLQINPAAKAVWQNALLEKEVVTVALGETTDASLLASFSRNRRRGIERAIESGAFVLRLETIEDQYLERFDWLYGASMIRLGAAKRWKYPCGIWEAYRTNLAPEHMTIWSAFTGKGMARPREPSAMLMVLHGYGKAHAHFIVSADEDHFTGLDDLLYFRAMCDCRRDGCHTFYAGGGRTSSPQDSLLRYKASFSTARRPVYVGRFVHNQEIYDQLSATQPESEFFPRYRASEAS